MASSRKEGERKGVGVGWEVERRSEDEEAKRDQ